MRTILILLALASTATATSQWHADERLSRELRDEQRRVDDFWEARGFGRGAWIVIKPGVAVPRGQR